MKVVALQEYTDKYISMYQGEIRNVTDELLAQDLIDKEILAEKTDGGEDTPEEEKVILEFTYDLNNDTWSCNHTWEEINEINWNKEQVKLDGNTFPIFLVDIQSSSITLYVRSVFTESTIRLEILTITSDDVTGQTVQYENSIS